MKLKYRLLDNGEGFVITRQPQLVSDKLCVFFEGAPQNATAIFRNSDDSYYRNLSENECSVPINKMLGEVSVTLTVLGGHGNAPIWRCEGLLFQKHENGNLFVLPNDMNIPQKFVDMKFELDEVKARAARLEKQNQELEKRLDKTETVHKKAIKELYELINKNKYI